MRNGFTLIEILVVIGMLGILASTALVAINPLHQFAQARNAQRISNVNAILGAIGTRIADRGGVFIDDACSETLPASSTVLGNMPGEYDIRPCLVPVYIPELPIDPSDGINTCTEDICPNGSYDTGYTVQLRSANRIRICAPHSIEDGLKEEYCVTR
jgi:prepilin-type N-terminal cleavage/methylation domain-containing protein